MPITPAVAASYRINEFAKFIRTAKETTYNTAATLAATDVIATMGLTGNIYAGDSETLSYDGDNGVDNPVLRKNPYNSFEWEQYGAPSGTAGTAPSIGKVLLMCGAKETITATTSAEYVSADVNSVDSGTLEMYRKVEAAKFLRYRTTGARGQAGFSFQDGGKGKFKITNMQGQYYEPDLVTTAVATTYGTQKTVLPLDANFMNTAMITFDGKQLCVQSLEIDNIFGFETNRVDLPGCSNTSFKLVTPTIKLVFRMPDWATAFNPYAKASTESGVQRLPFVCQIGHDTDHAGKILRITGNGANETQLTDVSETTLSDGNIGIQATLRCLSGLKLLYK